MAARYYGISRGEIRVTEGAATTGKELEVVIAVTGTVKRVDANVLLDFVVRHINTGTDNLVA
jgi:hypothetical protein